MVSCLIWDTFIDYVFCGIESKEEYITCEYKKPKNSFPETYVLPQANAVVLAK